MANESKHTSINTFTKGMNKDLDLSIIPKDSYLHAENFRIVTSKGNTSMALENIEGNTLVSSNIPTGFAVIGYCNIRSTLILFTTNKNIPGNTGTSQIVKFTVGESGLTNYTVLYNDANSIDGTKLNFSIANDIKAVGRYENADVQKVYWVDGYNNIRFMNIVGLDPTQSVTKFDTIPSFVISQPVIPSSPFVNGTLTAGKIQFAYQLFDNNGAETLFSPTSPLVSLSASNLFEANNKNFKGDDKGVNSGKGVKIIITPPSGYSRIRVVSIKYNDLNGIPSINIIAEQDLSTNPGDMTFID
jgi:hypothetical protein